MALSLILLFVLMLPSDLEFLKYLLVSPVFLDLYVYVSRFCRVVEESGLGCTRMSLLDPLLEAEHLNRYIFSRKARGRLSL